MRINVTPVFVIIQLKIIALGVDGLLELQTDTHQKNTCHYAALVRN